MFVQLNPDAESYSETISTLKFAERVSGVELGAARSNKEGRGIRELMDQVMILHFTPPNSFILFRILASLYLLSWIIGLPNCLILILFGFIGTQYLKY